MDLDKIAVLGAGSVRCMPYIGASLAAYFGELPVDVRLFDADAERLDLFDRYCRVLFRFNRADHSLMATTDPGQALDGVSRVILCVGQNCAEKYFRSSRRGGYATGAGFGLVEQLTEELMARIPDRVELLSLLGDEVSLPFPHYRRLSWPAEPTPELRGSIPYQILRFLNGEDYPHEILKDAGATPLKAWLENVESVPSVLGQRDR